MTDTARVRYYTRQFLRTEDFTDEQAYHLAAHRRHNIGGHSWGIVSGLEIAAEGDSVWVRPGFAVDGYGRDVVVADRLTVSTGAFDEQGTGVLAVFVAYDRVEGSPAEPGYFGCGAGETPFNRWIERPRLVLMRHDPYADPRAPDSVPVEDRQFDPGRTPPDDPDQDWPVFLGTVTRDLADREQPYRVDGAGRPYAGLVGRRIVTPDGRASVQLDAEDVDDAYRFAVRLAGTRDPWLGVTRAVTTEAGRVEETLRIAGDTTVDGDLGVPGRAVAFGAAVERPAGDGLWGMYRLADTQKGTDELRIEIPVAAPGRHRVVVGSWDADEEEFRPALTIDSSGDVTVHGDLVVEGRTFSAAPIEPALPEPVKNLALAGFLSGVGGASVLLDRLYRSPFTTTPPATPLLRAAAGLVTEDDDRLVELAAMIAENPEVAARLRVALQPPPPAPGGEAVP
ncbi:hypothetical protein AB0M02_32825 [Actinoplanes sp. NPDC051861]|uniref:hypothetical protein n=1 Tax=Actinoplanes sp. NPDC051861 TaxID=3155170 RepID=UPI0034368FED